MALGLSFRGSRHNRQGEPSAWAVSVAVEALREQFAYAIYQPSPAELILEFCPMGFLRILAGADEIEGEAATTPAGPGFHKAVVDFLDVLAAEVEMDLAVADETGYWLYRDFERLRREHMDWLQAVIRLILTKEGATFRVVWPLGGWVPAAVAGVITPMGWFRKDWLKSELARDGLTQFARTFFAWPNPERDALYYRGRALYLLWNECCWVRPRTESEAALLTEVLDSLARARSLDPALPLPQSAWDEVSGLVGDRPAAGGPDLIGNGPIGYRRGDLIESFPGGWLVRMPGSFLRLREPDGGYVYWDTERNLRLTPYRYICQACETSPFDERLVPHPALDEVVNGYRYLWATNQDPDEGSWVLQGLIRGPGGMAVVTITWTGERWTDWGVETFRSIQPPPMAFD